MKLTPFTKSLLKLCRKMKAADWTLEDGKAIRKLNPGPVYEPNHCPLSYCGGQRSMTEDYRAGGLRLGFSLSQVGEIARICDDDNWALDYFRQLRRIVIKAARKYPRSSLP